MFFNKSLTKFIKKHIIIIILVLFLANSSVAYMIYSKAQSASCMNQQQIDADPRCLYVYQNNVYQMGTRESPHQRNPCGITVDSIIPGFHFAGSILARFSNAKVAPFCTAQDPTAAPTQQPTTPPTQQPTQAPTQPATTQGPTATAIATIQATQQPTPTGGIGGYIPDPTTTSAPTQAPPNNTGQNEPTEEPTTANNITGTTTPIGPTNNEVVGSNNRRTFGDMLNKPTSEVKEIETRNKKPDYTKFTKPVAYFSLLTFIASLILLLF